MANRCKAGFQCLEDVLIAQVAKLFAEALEIAESVLVDETHEAEEFEQRVLERRGRQQKLRRPCQGPASVCWR